MNLFSLFWTFVKFGCVSFGGGYVLVPLMIAEMVEKRQIVSLEEFGNLVSVSQITPGPIGINSATYFGYLQGGAAGSLTASFGLILPSLVIGSTAVYSLARWKDSLWVKGLLKGVRPASLAILFSAVFLFLGMSVFKAPIPFDALFDAVRGNPLVLPEKFGLSGGGLLICVASAALLWKNRLSTTVLILLSAAAGAFLCR